MYELLCGCDEKEVIISNIKGAIDYYEKDIEWVGLAQKRLNKVIDEGIKSKSDVDFTKDLLKYKKKYYHCIYVFAIRVLLSVSTS